MNPVHRKLQPIRHQDKLVTHRDHAGFQLTHQHQPAHFLVALKHGQLHGRGQKALRWFEMFERVDDRLAVVPRAHVFWHRVLQIHAGQSRRGNPVDVALLPPDALEERPQLLDALVVARLRPRAVWVDDGGVVHFVDDDHELPHARRLGEHCVLARLPTAFETGLKFPFSRRNHKHAHVRLRCATNHLRHKALMPWRVQNHKPPGFRCETRASTFFRLALVALVVRQVQRPRVFPALAVLRLGLALIFFHRPIIHIARQVQQMP
mmetsp:Transcript_6018/g.12756  ORF Transcript_6018/g.12756 Transcript_6018/m.12756 type:complete len:264 (-) Transcript_6018:736-1527(-)